MGLLPTTVTAGQTGALANTGQIHRKLNGAFIDVQADYGAKGDGATDDTTAINNAITAAATMGASVGAGGATVYFPPGVYLHSGTIVGKSQVRLLGAGRWATVLKRSADVVSVSWYGTDVEDRCWYGAMEQLTVEGDDFEATLVDLVHASQFMLYNVVMHGSLGRALDLVETWDSNFTNLFCESCGGVGAGAPPTIHLRNARASSGFGSSTDNTNEIRFTHLHIEANRAGAIRIEKGFGDTQPNGVYIFDLKIENHTVSGDAPFVYIAPEANRVHIEKVYVYAGDLLDGGPVDVIENLSVRNSSLRDVFVSTGPEASIKTAAKVDGGKLTVVDGIYGDYDAPPTTAHVQVTYNEQLDLRNIYATAGVLLTGYQMAPQARTARLYTNDTIASTTAALVSGLTFTNVYPGGYLLELHGLYQSSSTSNGPRFGFGGTAAVTEIAGWVSMNTSATAVSTATLTSLTATGGANPGSSGTPLLVTARMSLTVTDDGTLAVRWVSSNASATGTLLAGSYATLTRID